jgi:Na+-driven multidrug efflux pump
VIAAVVGAHWGLAGVIYGVAVGWMVRSVSAFYMVARHLRLPPAEQAPEPATAP